MSDSAVFHETDDDSFRDASGPITEFPGAGGGGSELDYVEITSDVTVTATTSGGANTVIDGNSVSYDGSTIVIIEFFAAIVGTTTGSLVIELYEDSTLVRRLAQLSGGGTATNVPVFCALRRTPSSGSHTYHIKAWKTGGTATIFGSNSSTVVPAFLRIYEA